MSETHEHLEQAEHAAHGADPFTMRVAMTMAIIAAVLAAVSLLGHRKHNEALQKQGEANRLKTEAAEYEVKQSNTFAWYQSKRARVEQANNSIALTRLLAPIPVPLNGYTDDAGGKKSLGEADAGRAAYQKAYADRDSAQAAERKKWEDYIKKNDTKVDSIKVDEDGFPAKNEKGEDNDTLGALIIKGNRYKALSEEKTGEAKQVLKAYELVHHQADGLDWAHLAVELGLVLCTIAVLTKRREFWLTGILAAVVGIGLAAQALLLVH